MNSWGKFLLLFVLSLSVGCSGFESKLGGENSAGSLSTRGTSSGNLGTLSASIDAKHSLGESETYPIQFTNATNYRGTVAFEIDRSVLANIQGQEDISISLSSTELDVTPGEVVNLFLTIDSPYQSPSFSARQLSVIVRGDGGLKSELKVPLSVSPVVEIELNECDYQNNATLDDCWNVPASIDLRSHSAGVSIRYTNCDSSSNHIVHGNGPIRHQPTNQPLPQAAASNCAGSYNVQVAAAETGQGSYYMHDTQGGGQRRIINFGVQNPLAARAASVADTFDRGPSNAGSCHDPVGQD